MLILLFSLTLAISCVDLNIVDIYGRGKRKINYNLCLDHPSLNFTYVSIVPGKNKIGEKLNFDGDAIANKDLVVKDVETTIYLRGRKLVSNYDSLRSLEIAKGETSHLAFRKRIPQFASGGEYDVIAKFRDDKENILSCIRISLTL